MKEKGKGLLHGAAVLTGGMLLVKVIGALFKIPLSREIGEYGMGLFNGAYSLFGPVFSLATAGFPVAVSRLVSEELALGRDREALRVRRTALPLFFTLGGGGMLLLTLLAPLYCDRVVGTRYALLPVLALAPAVLFSCGAAVYRGWFAGQGDMVPTAVSQVVEALGKLLLGLFGARWAVARGAAEHRAMGTVFGQSVAGPEEARFLILAFGAGFAVLGVTCGSGLSLLYLRLRRALAREKGRGPAPDRRTARRLLRLTGPIALGSIAANAAGLIDGAILQSRLSGLEPADLAARWPGSVPSLYLENPEALPTYLYGCYTLAMTVYLLVPSLTQTLGLSALPQLTALFVRGDRRALGAGLESALRVTALLALPAGMGMTALAAPIVTVLYGEQASGPIVAGCLAPLGIAAMAAGMCGPLSSLLQAVGRADLPAKLLGISMGVKLAVTWLLCGRPEWNLLGAAMGTVLGYGCYAALQLAALARAAGRRFPLGRIFAPPLLCSLLCGMTAWGSCRLLRPVLPAGRLGECLALGCAIPLGAGFYAVGLLLFAGVQKSEIEMLPKGEKIAKTLEKWKWIC